MKKIIFCLGLGLGAAWAAWAAELPGKMPELSTDTVIDAEHWEYRPEYDASGGLVVYSGHVVLVNPRIKLLCDRLLIYLPKNGEQPNHIEAQTNVVIIKTSRGDTTRATCSLAVYTRTVLPGKTNSIVTLTGNPLPFIENAKGTGTGSPIIWNLESDTYTGSNIRMTFKQGAIEGTGTNKAALKIF